MRRIPARALPNSDGCPGCLAPVMRPEIDACQTVPLGTPNYDRNASDRPIRVGRTLSVPACVVAATAVAALGTRTASGGLAPTLVRGQGQIQRSAVSTRTATPVV